MHIRFVGFIRLVKFICVLIFIATACGNAKLAADAAPESAVSAAFGRILTTSEGAFGQNFTGPSLPSNCGSALNYCYGPITFFLINPNAAKTLTLNGFFDNGPSSSTSMATPERTSS